MKSTERGCRKTEMKHFLSYDGTLQKALTKIMYVVSLNLLFLVCSIPVFTIGAAATAMHSMLIALLRGDEPNILSGYFHAFKSNFRKSTTIWLGILLLGLTIAVDIYIFSRQNYFWAPAMRVIISIVLTGLHILLVYIFSAAAYFSNSVKGYLLFSIRLAIAKLPYTFVLAAIYVLPLLLILFLAQFSQAAVLALLLCGFSLPAYLSDKIIIRLFKPLEEADPDYHQEQ